MLFSVSDHCLSEMAKINLILSFPGAKLPPEEEAAGEMVCTPSEIPGLGGTEALREICEVFLTSQPSSCSLCCHLKEWVSSSRHG